MTISFTERAAAQIKSSTAKMGGIGLRLGVKRVGCNGYAYTYDVAKEVGQDDTVFEAHDTKVVIDAGSMPFLAGCELDFVRDGFKQMFTVTNPNAKGMCGCGESFNV
jgi:iron-sulfur cluster assembly protein